MKKLTAGLLALFLLTACAGAAVWAKVWPKTDDVELSFLCTEGSEENVEGLCLHVRSDCLNRLLWETAYTFGEGEPKTAFRYCANEYNGMRFTVESNIFVNICMGFGIGGNVSMEKDFAGYPGLARLFTEVAANTEPGEQHDETVVLSDYTEYFPMNVDLNTPFPITSENRDDMAGRLFCASEAEWAVAEYFKMKVPEGFLVNATVRKTEDGEIDNINLNYAKDYEDYGIYQSCSAGDSEGCYLAWYSDRDTSRNGVYYFDYSQMRDRKDWAGFEPQFLSLLPEGEELLDIELDGYGVPILYMCSDGGVFAHVLDPVTGEDTKSIRLLEDRAYTNGIYNGEGFTAVTLMREQQLPDDEEGLPVFEYSGYTAVIAGEGHEHMFTCRLSPDSALSWTMADSVAFDGERLAYASMGDWWGMWRFSLEAYDKTGCIYRSEAQSSLGLNAPAEKYGDKRCELWYADPLTIEFVK